LSYVAQGPAVTAIHIDNPSSPDFVEPNRYRLLIAGFRAQIVYLPVVLAYWIGYQFLLYAVPGSGDLQFYQLLLKVLAAVILMTFLSYIIHKFFRMVVVERPPHPFRYLARSTYQFFSHPRRLALGLPMLLIFVFFAAIFTDIKQNIPRISNFSWDMTLAEWDRLLHFGKHPWQWLQPVLGYPVVTFLINFIYNFWFFAMWIFVVYLAFGHRTSALRTRFFLAFFLSWSLGGSLLALVFSSAGPCYFSRLGLSPDPYAELMSYLHSVTEIYPVWALNVQDTLWQSYTQGGFVAGISAMPSMHNATALLMALAGRRINRQLGYVLWIHCALIFIGSIHLAWHYAVDNYFGWAVALACWWIARPLARWWEGQTHIRRLGQLIELIPADQAASAPRLQSR
jgi:hypothetical protein